VREVRRVQLRASALLRPVWGSQTQVITTTLHRTTETERAGTLDLGHPRPTITVTARHIRHATAADTAPVVIREGEPVVILTTDAPRCGKGVLAWCWDEEADRWGWSGHWLVDGYDWIVTLDDGALELRDGKALMFWEAAE